MLKLFLEWKRTSGSDLFWLLGAFLQWRSVRGLAFGSHGSPAQSVLCASSSHSACWRCFMRSLTSKFWMEGFLQPKNAYACAPECLCMAFHPCEHDNMMPERGPQTHQQHKFQYEIIVRQIHNRWSANLAWVQCLYIYMKLKGEIPRWDPSALCVWILLARFEWCLAINARAIFSENMRFVPSFGTWKIIKKN